MKKGLEESKPCLSKLCFRLDSYAVLHVTAAVVAGVGVEIHRGAMVQPVAGAEISSNIDADSYRAGRHGSPADDAYPRFFCQACIYFHHFFRPNLPLSKAALVWPVLSPDRACQNLIVKLFIWSAHRLRIEKMCLLWYIGGTGANGWTSDTSISSPKEPDIAPHAAAIPVFYRAAENWLQWSFPPVHEDVPGSVETLYAPGNTPRKDRCRIAPGHLNSG